MPNDLHDYMICQAICDSLTLRSANRQYFIYEQYGVHYISYADRTSRTVTLVDHGNSYAELIDILVLILEECIADA